MNGSMNRRMFSIALPAGIAGLASTRLSLARGAESPSGDRGAVPSSFPQQDPALVAKVVGLSHRDLKGVQELVEPRPALAKAAYDWGFGDWETALGAASHTGQRAIAEYLISKGARPDIFTFAMLGNLSAVKALCEAYPAFRSIAGPHGISLLAHAKAGGEPAKDVAAYLESLGDANPRYTDLPTSDEDKKRMLGAYRFGTGELDRLEVGEGMGGITIKRSGGNARRLFRQEDGSYHPAGATVVRVRFDLSGAGKVTIADADVTVVAERA